MMLDLASFGDEKFQAKSWVNAACKARHPDDSLDKYLGDLEMKLQLMAENIAASLEEQSAQALLRVPRASRDVFRVRDDAVSLRSTVSAVLQKLRQVLLSLFPCPALALPLGFGPCSFPGQNLLEFNPFVFPECRQRAPRQNPWQHLHASMP